MDVSNVLSEEKKKQVIALGQSGVLQAPTRRPSPGAGPAPWSKRNGEIF